MQIYVMKKVLSLTCSLGFLIATTGNAFAQASLTSGNGKSADNSATAAPIKFATDADIQAILDKHITNKTSKGIAVAVVEANGETRFLNAGGSGRPERPQIDADTIFEIGSITKTFTGILLAQMVERGEVKLTDTVRMFVPKDVVLPSGGAGDITLLKLATHTSGLPRLPMSMAMIGAMAGKPDNPYQLYTKADMWTYLAERKHDAAQNYPSDYSNLGMGLLGELLANRAGISYAELVKRNITDPLGMKDTWIDVPTNEMARFAIGHSESLKEVSYWELPAFPGAGAIRSTTRDMAKFIAAQMNGSLAGSRFSHEPRAKFDERVEVGLAWMTLKARGDEIVWHNGGTGGFRTFAGFSKKSGRGVVVLANTSASMDEIGRHILNSAFPSAPAAKPPRLTSPGSLFVIGVTALVWISALVMPWRVRYGETPASSNSAPKPRWWKRGSGQALASRHDAAWAMLNLFVIAGLLAIFGPWAQLGILAQAAKWMMIVTLLMAALAILVRARALPWRAGNAIGISTILGRVIVGVLAAALVYVFIG
jgi:serine-type D-Ala-D-Ala carboxypeptidase/endopeptidase